MNPSLKIVSFVPSWTETLIASGAHVVGRTRFCIHPSESVKSIPVVGGTKDLKLEILKQLKPDLIVLDREENTKEMFEALEAAKQRGEIGSPRLHVSHVQSVLDMPRELRALELESLAVRYEKILRHDLEIASIANENRLKTLPGVIEIWSDPQEFSEALTSNRPIVYVIWKEPWMVVSEGTFIASMLEQVGIAHSRLWPSVKLDAGSSGNARYPKFELSELPKDAIVLLSSEPFPFAKKKADVETLISTHPVALVDGESFSWFGLRALEFLEAQNLSKP